jgi:hypothetical protein
MKLELKYMATYLPYGLNGILLSDLWEDGFDFCDPEQLKKGTIWKLCGYTDPDLNVPLGEGEYDGYLWRNGYTYACFYKEIKPVLRPLSDLTNPIEIDKRTFIPRLELAEKLLSREPESFDNIGSCLQWIDMAIIQEVQKEKGYDNIPHWIFQDLIKWHFDLFLLINNNLAININEIK